MPRTFLSLYSGAGGMDIGFAQAGLRPGLAVEIDKSAAATHTASFERLADRLPHLRGRVEPCIAADVVDSFGLLNGTEASLVIGGPPCQGFSVAGKMNPDDPRSQHVWHFLDAVEQAAPYGFVMENVKALLVNRRWALILDRLQARTRRLGLVPHLMLLNAAHFGVPQFRERVFLIGLPPGAPFRGPLPTHAETLPSLLETRQPPAEAKPPVTVREALASLPPYGAPGNDRLCTAKITPAQKPILRASPYAGMLFNGAGRPMNLDAPAPTLPASMGGNRTPIVDQARLDGAADCWAADYHARLLAGGKPADTVPPRLRRLTVQEAAAIQGFPADMEWHGPQSAVFRQIGNAVPPPLAQAVAEAVLEALDRC